MRRLAVMDTMRALQPFPDRELVFTKGCSLWSTEGLTSKCRRLFLIDFYTRFHTERHGSDLRFFLERHARSDMFFDVRFSDFWCSLAAAGMVCAGPAAGDGRSGGPETFPANSSPSHPQRCSQVQHQRRGKLFSCLITWLFVLFWESPRQVLSNLALFVGSRFEPETL